jgi:hypothetical protein
MVVMATVIFHLLALDCILDSLLQCLVRGVRGTIYRLD